MSISNGPKTATSNLVFAIDVASPQCINASGCTGYNNAPQLVKNLVDPTQSITSTSTLKLGNLSYYTAFAIDYPEGSYGGAAAGRQGITPGFNVTSGTKTYEASRALHLWVWDNINSAWVPDAYFTGERYSGHCYDSYLGTASVDLFVADYNKIKAAYPDCTYIVLGSHRDSAHTSAQYAILKDLGAPSNVDSIIGFSSPEWILVGKPGIGPGNGAWSFQNYSTNADYVAHMNFALPFKGGPNNYLSFSGSNSDSITGLMPSAYQPSTNSIDRSWEVLVRPTVSQATAGLFGHVVGAGCSYYCNGGVCIASGNYCFNWYDNSAYQFLDSGVAATSNQWAHVVGTYSSSDNKTRIYVNGVLKATYGSTTNLNYGGYGYYYQTGYLSASGNYFTGDMSVIKYYYNKALSSTEVEQNFQALRGRFGI